MKNRIFKNITLILLSVSALFMFSCSKDCVEAEITAFTFLQSDNDFLTEDITGDLDGKVITAALPAELYGNAANRKNLKASISVNDGSSIVGDGNFDFSESPVKVSVMNESGSTEDYVVVLKKETFLEKGDLLFTEYYMGAEYAFKGENNQYLEITNFSSTAIDLSDVKLTKTEWNNGKRTEDADRSVYLKGTLAAGKSFVLYSSRTGLSFTEKYSTTDTIFASDADFNSIMTCDGQDGFILSYEGNVLDVLGSDDGSTNRERWGYVKKLQRKITDPVEYSKWNEDDWIITKASGTSTAGTSVSTPGYTSDSSDLIYFAFEDLSDVIYGTIKDKKITFNLSKDESLSQKLVVGSTGKCVWICDDEENPVEQIVNGVTEINLNKYSYISVESEEGVYGDTYEISFTQRTFEQLTSAPEAGDQIIIYYPEDKLVLNTSLTGTTAVESNSKIGYQDGMCVFTVEVNADGTYSFKTEDDKYLVASSSSAIELNKSKGSYGNWTIEDSGDEGLFFITIMYSGSKRYLEYYSGFKLYNYQASYADEYKLAFFKEI